MGAAASSQAYDSPDQVAAKLSKREPCVLAFLSPHCGLCSSLRPALSQASSSSTATGALVQVAPINAQLDKMWAPEMLAYEVETVPCFVLLQPDGRAVCKTPTPRSRQQMEAALAEMLEQASRMAAQQPAGNRKKSVVADWLMQPSSG